MALLPIHVLRQALRAGRRWEDQQPRDYGDGMRSYTAASLLIPPSDSLPLRLGDHGSFTKASVPGRTNYEFRNASLGHTYYWDGYRWELLRVDGDLVTTAEPSGDLRGSGYPRTA